MALLIYKDNRTEEIDAERSYKIWDMFIGVTEGTQAQQKFCARIKQTYLNWHSERCPDSYIEQNLEALIPMFTNNWVVNEDGEPLYPEPGWKRGIYLAEKFGLVSHGKATSLVTKHY